MHRRLSASAQLAECIVASTRCPVSAALSVSRMTSGVSISLMTSTSGFSRSASMMPCSKLGACVGISRCRIKERRLLNRYSNGLSSVTKCRAFDPLISSINAASVVDLPDPVGPEMITSPEFASMSRRKSGCRLQARRSLTEGASKRIAIAMPRTVWKKLARQHVPPIATDMSAEPRVPNNAQPSAPSSAWLACASRSVDNVPPTICNSPRMRATIGVSASRCTSLAPSARALLISSSNIRGRSTMRVRLELEQQHILLRESLDLPTNSEQLRDSVLQLLLAPCPALQRHIALGLELLAHFLKRLVDSAQFLRKQR